MNQKKMDKKALGTHVDWVISMGIFLIFLLFFIVVIKPGYKPVYTGDILLSIVEDNFEKNVSWVIKKAPLFVRECSMCNVPPTTIPCIIDEKDISENDWGLELYENNIKRDTEIKCESPEDYLKDKELLLFVHPNKWYDFDDPTNDPKIELSLTPGLIEDCCDAELGTLENIKGISEEWLDNLKSYEDYDTLKQNWKYPKQKEFVIYVDEDNNEKYEKEEKITNSPEPYQQANIFVKEYKTWIVKQNGEKKLVKVSLRVW